MMHAVRCQAIVDPAGPGKWSVTVTGLPPHDETRVYVIEGKSDNIAAQEGLRRFVAERERPKSRGAL